LSPKLIPLFYALNLLLLLSGLLVFRLTSGERRFSLSLIQALLGLPLLAGEYGSLASHLEGQAGMMTPDRLLSR